MYMYVCHTIQIGTTVNNQSNYKWLVKVNHEQEDLIPIENDHLCFSANRNEFS